jgi:cation transport ATPase
MSQPEDETPPLDDLSASADDLTFAEPEADAGQPAAEAAGDAEAAEPSEAGEDLAGQSQGEAAEAAEPAEAAEEAAAEGEEEKEGKEGKEPKKKTPEWVFHAQWGGAAALCVAIYLIFFLTNIRHAPWHAFYLITLVVLATATWMTRKIWATFEVTAFYTLVLAGAVAALLTGIYCLGLELCDHSWDIKAKTGKAAATAAQQSSPYAPPASQPR